MFLPQNSSKLQEQENDNEFLPNQSQSYQYIVLEHEQRRSLILADHSSLPSQGLPSVANVSRPSNRQESRVSSQQPALISRNEEWRQDRQEDDGENEFMLDQNSLAEQISKALVREESHMQSHSNSKHFQNHIQNDEPSALWQPSNRGFGLPNQSQNSQDNPFEVRGNNMWKEESHVGLDNFSKSQKSQSKEKLASEEDQKMPKNHQQSQEEYFDLGKKSNAFESKFDGEQEEVNRFEENSYPNQQQSVETDPFRQENESHNNFPGELHSNVESNPLRSSVNRQSIEKTQSKRKLSEMERPNESSFVNQQDTISREEIKIEGNSLSQLMMQDRIGGSMNESHSGRDSLKFRQIDSLAGGSSQVILQSEVNLYVKPVTKRILPKQNFQHIVLRQNQGEEEEFADGGGLNNEERSGSHPKSSKIDPEDYNEFVNQIQMQEYAVKSSNLELRSNKSALFPSGMEQEQIAESQQSQLEKSHAEDMQHNSKDNSQNQPNFQSLEPIDWKNNESNMSQRSNLADESNEQSNSLNNPSQIKKLKESELQKQHLKSSSEIQQHSHQNLIEEKTVENMKANFAPNQSQVQQEKSESHYHNQSHSNGQLRYQSSKLSEENMQNLQNSSTDKKVQYNFASHQHESSRGSQKSQNSNIMNNRSNIYQQEPSQKQPQQQSNLSKESNQRQDQWQGSYSKTSEVRQKQEEYGSKSGRNYRIQQSELSRIQMNNSEIIDEPHFKNYQNEPSQGEKSPIASQKSYQGSVKVSSLKRQTLEDKNKSSSLKDSQMSVQKSYIKGGSSQISNGKSQSSKLQTENKSKVLSQINSVTKKESYLKDNNYQRQGKDHKQYLVSSTNHQQTNSTLFKKKEETKEMIFNTFPEEEPLVTQSQEHNIEIEHASEKKLVLSPINQTKNQLDKREKILSLRTPESRTKKKTEQKEDQIERIRLLKQSQKKRLERELEKVKKELEEIQIRERHAERIQKQGEERLPKEQEKLSMHNRHKRQSEAVLKLVKEHRKSREQEQQQFQDLDRNITNNLMELSRIRHEAQIKNKEKKRLEIMQRMKKNEMRRIQEQKLIKANIQYVQQFRSPEGDREKEKEAVKDKQREVPRLKGKDRDMIADKQRNISRERDRNVEKQRQRERNVITEVKITKLRSVGKRRKDDVYQARLD